jgi:hypothetical protein
MKNICICATTTNFIYFWFEINSKWVVGGGGNSLSEHKRLLGFITFATVCAKVQNLWQILFKTLN